MLEGLREGWTTVGLLRRLVVLLLRGVKAWERIAEAQELQLKLEVLVNGGTLEELKSAPMASAADTVEEEEDPSEAELAEMYRDEQAVIERRGRPMEDDEDPREVQRKWLEEGGE